MFRFENESFLYLFILVGILIALYVVLNIVDRKRLQRFCNAQMLERLVPQKSAAMKHVKFGLLMLALSCFIIAAANPQTAGKMEKTKRQGVDVMFCLDVSNSMLARDIQPNRLEACKMSMSRFIDKLGGDRVGVVIFAGTAFVQLPATTDYAAAKMFINKISTSQISLQGTDLSAALITAGDALMPENEDDTKKNEKESAKVGSKVIILVSDGEDHFPESASTAADLHETGIVVHTIGIGSPQGTTIPMGKDGAEMKKDQEGNTVITRLNEQALKDVAEKGGGVYVHAKNTAAGFDAILEEIDKMEKSDIEDVSFSRFNSWFQYPLAIGLILLLVEGFLFAVRPKWQDWLNALRMKLRKTPMLFLAVLLLLVACNREKTRPSVIQKGNVEFQRGDSLLDNSTFSPTEEGEYDTTGQHAYEQALAMYDEAFNSESSNRNQARFNQIDAHYRLHNYDTIGKLSDTLLQMNASKNMAAQIYYNKGNAFLQKKQYQDAVEAFKESLRRNPNDMDAKYNLVYAKRMADQHGNGGGSGSGGGGGQDQQQQNQNGQGQNDQNDQNGQNGQNSQNSQNQQNQNGQNQQGQGGRDQQQQQQNAATLRQLDALQNAERNTQNKVQQFNAKELNKEKSRTQKQERDW